MAHIHGKGGDVDVGSSVTGAKDWSLSFDGDTVETTDFIDAGVKTFIAGGSGWTATVTVNKDGAPDVTMGATVSLSLEEVAGDSSAKWTGSAIVNSIGVSVSVDDIVVYTLGFQGTGALTVATG